MATEDTTDAKTDAEQLLEAGIDFAVPPQANERQIEDAMLAVTKETVEQTNKKLDRFWEAKFNRDAPKQLHDDVSAQTKQLQTIAAQLKRHPSSNTLLAKFVELNNQIVGNILGTKQRWEQKQQTYQKTAHPQRVPAERLESNVRTALGEYRKFLEWRQKKRRSVTLSHPNDTTAPQIFKIKDRD